MKTVINSIKSIILAAIVAAVGVNSTNASYVARNATESVFFAHGYVEAYAEGEDLFYLRGLTEARAQGETTLNNANINRIGFTLMARNNSALLRSFIQGNDSTGRFNIMIAYLSGRVAAFLALAELYGE